MTVPFNFATQSGNIPLSELDANFANVSASTLTATYVTGNNQSNITDVGTLNSLSAYGNVTAGNVSTNGIVRANAVIGVNYTGTNISVTGNVIAAKGIQSGGSITRTGSMTATAWGTNGVGLKIPTALYTDNSSPTGTVATSYIHSLAAPTLVQSNAVTITNAATLFVAAPTTGANATITNAYAIIANGAVQVNGNISVSTVQTDNLVVNNIYSDDSTYVTVNDGLEIFGDLISESLDVAGNAVINNLTVTGNFIGTDITVNSIKNGSSNVDITNLNGNITIGVDGINNVLVVTSAGAIVTGTIEATNTLQALNVVVGNISSDGSTAITVLDDLSVHGDVDVIGDISATGNVTGGNVLTGIVSASGNVTSANFRTNGNVSATGNIYAGISLRTNGAVTTIPTALANLSNVTVAGARAFVNDANLIASNNFGALVGSGGSNTVPIWCDGTNWYVG